MIAIGILRWFLNLQREEIQILLDARGTGISTGEISYLSEEFLLRFYILHKKKIPQLKSIFNKNGGVILHLDGTGEAGDDIVFTAEEGRTRIKIVSQIMPSENSEDIKSFLKSLKTDIGTPIVIIRDMSKNIKDAASEVFPETLQLICHYHFVSNLGKLIFKEEYESFRKKLISTRTLAQFVSQKEKISERFTFQSTLVEAECKWVAVAIEHILWPREQLSGFPFVLPYYEIMNRILEIKDLIKKIIDWNSEQNLLVNPMLDFYQKIENLIQMDEIKNRYIILKKVWSWFEEVRNILEVSRHLKEDSQKKEPKSILDIKADLKKLIQKIKNETKEGDKKITEISRIILSECNKHWDELTSEVKDLNGNDVHIVRHNGILETNHRWSRMHARRRTGRSRTTNDMAKYGALTAILSNLENELYVKEVLSSIDDFVFELQNITKDEIEVAKKLIKPYYNDYIVRSDPERINLLHDFIGLLERSNKKNTINVKIWLDKLNQTALD